MTNVYIVEVDVQPIELYKLLKIADLVSGGGEAKIVISEGYVLLNNEVEYQKRKKVYDGDYIQFGDNIIEVKYVEQENNVAQADKTPKQHFNSQVKAKSTKNQSKKRQANQKSKENATNKGKRRAISF